MEPWDEPIDPRLKAKLEVLQEVPPRRPQAAANGRANFLAQAQAMVNEPILVQAVSRTEERRPIGWIEKISTLFGRKERSPMLTTLISIFVVASLLLGGGGASVYAAQDSLPGEPLYAVKTLGEDVRLDLAGSAQAQLALELGYANRRVDEMRQLAGRGEPVPEAVEARYQQQMGTAFQITTGLADADLLPALERVRQALRTQERALQDLPGGAGAQAVLDRVRDRVRLHLQLVEDGLQDPQAYRRQLRQGLPLNGPGDPGQGPGACQDCPKAGETPGAGNSYGPGPAASQEPAGGAGNSYGPRPAASQEPAGGAGNSFGTGPQASGTSVPGSGYGPGPSASQEPKEGAGNSYGPGPGSTEAPRSGPQDGAGQQNGGGQQNGAGNGSDSGDCIPNGDGTGAQATQAPGGGGSGDGTCDGCGTGPNGSQPPASDPGSGAGGGQDSGQGSGSGSPAGGGGGRP